jgi:glycosyltransferase involved in cell wall biosynthesis
MVAGAGRNLFMIVEQAARGERDLEPCPQSSRRLHPKPRVFILQDFYLPGEKVGGPVWTIANMVEHVGDRFEFMIAALDRDFMSNTPYPSIERNAWNRVGKASVFYASQLSSRNIVSLIRESAPDILYLNSFFGRSTVKTLILRRLRYILDIPVVLAPHGEFSVGALEIKARKKRAYVGLARKLDLCRDVVWHASTAWEEKEIKDTIGPRCHTHIAPELTPLPPPEDATPSPRPNKSSGELRLVFLSRITPKKNLLQALDIVRAAPGDIALDIFGPIEDQAYWRECLREIYNQPRKNRVRYCGMVPHAKVWETLSRYQMFFLPTLGENFGYAILEALTVGCPVVISDRTPWRNLAVQRVGWDVPLDKPERWQGALREAVAMDNATYASFSTAARQFARAWMNSPDLDRQAVALLERALESNATRPRSAPRKEWGDERSQHK